ncbi:beta-lactamase regulating signal transducer with metallopeptidase domain [Spirosoma oryzae]|uniref:Beta-lactamase regulating signal transducer with metallopeptidase domain n=1 Tax=Spirosoma oryzae TaxID=1469603 RepID=A0A2T0T5M9_9BACT|nr:M56 family metallopeptidase [Spirosoma oryzae]PRY40985.1 beta-lactamase regulating signal transducer with metallopeptidase domain [Spirosoma oryzae]
MITIEFLDSPVARALGWTLLHALWQGFALVLPTAILLHLLRHRSSLLRYRIGTLTLFAQLLVSAATFVRYYQPSRIATTVAALPLRWSISARPLPWPQQALLFLEAHLSDFVCLYLIGVALFGVRLAGGWLHLRQLRRSAIGSPLPIEQAMIDRLRAVLNLRTVVRVRKSARVTGPMVIGVLKPMLLLPAGLATGLSPRELEAVLAHELAHVKRNDYAVNLLQSVVEILYFFHPALWWLSARVREEREHCCDDMAVQVCGDNGRALANALARIEERRLEQVGTPALAMAFAGRRQLLLHRVQRVLGLSTRSMVSNRSLAGLTLATLFLVSASVYAIQRQDKPQPPKPNVTVNTKIDAPKQAIEAVSPAVSVAAASPEIRLSPDTVPTVASYNPAEKPIVEVHDSVKVGNEWITIRTVDGSKSALQDTSQLQRAQRQLEQLSNELTRIMAERQPAIDRLSKEMENLALKNTSNQKHVQALQEQQTKLVAQQSLLVTKQMKLARQLKPLQADIDRLSAQNSKEAKSLLAQKLRQQEQLERQMDALGTQMGDLGGQMGDLGGQMADQIAPYQQRMEILADSINKLVEPTYAYTEKIGELSGIIAENINQQAEKAMEMANEALYLNKPRAITSKPVRRSAKKYRVVDGVVVPGAPAPPAIEPRPMRPARPATPAIEAHPAAPARPATPPKAIKGKAVIPTPPKQ